ncbi:hypothetical protein [Soonwooa sp.]|uniref:hypothetical protein n=1 Tax=Soonwooa sp. TaxID=1938592 RepID=UPI00261203A2|nr:hypothetical protein [Soonwooa sp.]
MLNKKVAGLWIDGRKAIVVSNHDAETISDFELKGNLKMEVQGGNSNEHTANNIEKTNRVKFYKEIEKEITNSTELYITGPGIAQEELRNYLLDTPQYKNLKITLGTDSQLSDAEVLNEVKSHYKA